MRTKIISLQKYDQSKLNRLVTIHLGKIDLASAAGYVHIDSNKKLLGYTLLKKSKSRDTVMIDWIWSKPGYGTSFLKKIERKLFQKYKKIILICSVSPKERKTTVMKRVNFYIKNQYRVYNIRFRNSHGVSLDMVKKIDKKKH